MIFTVIEAFTVIEIFLVIYVDVAEMRQIRTLTHLESGRKCVRVLARVGERFVATWGTRVHTGTPGLL